MPACSDFPTPCRAEGAKKEAAASSLRPLRNMVPRKGLEPLQDFSHYPLKIACLPIPPPRHGERPYSLGQPGLASVFCCFFRTSGDDARQTRADHCRCHPRVGPPCGEATSATAPMAHATGPSPPISPINRQQRKPPRHHRHPPQPPPIQPPPPLSGVPPCTRLNGLRWLRVCMYCRALPSSAAAAALSGNTVRAALAAHGAARRCMTPHELARPAP